MSHRASAVFENLSHESTPLSDGPPSRARLAIRRRWTGDLTGESTGDLVACWVSETDFSYVGLDAFEGELAGRRGAFVFQHGQHRAGDRTVVFGVIIEGSGQAGLAGITGEIRIVFSGTQHEATIDYELP